MQQVLPKARERELPELPGFLRWYDAIDRIGVHLFGSRWGSYETEDRAQAQECAIHASWEATLDRLRVENSADSRRVEVPAGATSQLSDLRRGKYASVGLASSGTALEILERETMAAELEALRLRSVVRNYPLPELSELQIQELLRAEREAMAPAYDEHERWERVVDWLQHALRSGDVTAYFWHRNGLPEPASVDLWWSDAGEHVIRKGRHPEVSDGGVLLISEVMLARHLFGTAEADAEKKTSVSGQGNDRKENADLVPSPEKASRNAKSGKNRRPPGRPKGAGAINDASVLHEMHRLIEVAAQKGEKLPKGAAAKLIANVKTASDIARVVRKYGEMYPQKLK